MKTLARTSTAASTQVLHWRRSLGAVRRLGLGIALAATIVVSAAPHAEAVSTGHRVTLIGGSITGNAGDAAYEADLQGWFGTYYPGAYGGGTLLRWSDPRDDRWKAFDAFELRVTRQFGPATAVWFELVLRDYNVGNLTIEEIISMAVAAVEQIRTRTDAPIFVSPTPIYLPGSPQCGITDDAAIATALAVDWLVANGHGFRGPVRGPYAPEHVRRNNCHLRPGGDALDAALLNAFDWSAPS